MLESAAKTITFLKGLRRDNGGYADTNDGEATLRAMLSVLKALKELGALETDPRAVGYVLSCRHADGGFSIQPDKDPAPYDTAVGLICLRTLEQADLLAEALPQSLAYIHAHATTQFDHFMLVATHEECQVVEPVPATTIEFFQRQLQTSLEARKVVDAAIAAASIIRAGQALPDPHAVAELMRSGQNTPEGGFGEGNASLFVTYCAMRTLVLLDELPSTRRLMTYSDSLRTELGYTDVRGVKTSAGATYQNVSMQTWVHQLQHVPVNAARRGDLETLRGWLANGGDPNLYDSEGWTALLAAASHGQSAAVDLLLNHNISNAPKADPSLRYEVADALPIYMAGQAGDLETVKLLLRAAPEHLHAISAVNGHSLLLQAAFYGKSKHLELAAYLLDHAAEISGLPAQELGAEQARLLSATNVRGYNALSMQDLWHNQKMKDLLLRYYPADQVDAMEEQRRQYHARLMLDLAAPEALTEKMMVAIAEYLASEAPSSIGEYIDTLLTHPGFQIDRLGGELQMTPLIFAITGVDVGNPARAARRYALAKKLLEAGADPAVREKHPMAVGAVIRASVLNNFGLLQLIAEYMTPEDFARELNVSPAVNGLTAMHDAIHRALTSPSAELEGHLAQITWMIQHGARLDIPDNVGQTQYELAQSALKDAAFPPENTRAVMAAVESTGQR